MQLCRFPDASLKIASADVLSVHKNSQLKQFNGASGAWAALYAFIDKFGTYHLPAVQIQLSI
jgi:hypothetical protein